MPKEHYQHLRRSIKPYVGQVLILVIVTGWVVFVAVFKHQWKLTVPIPVIWFFFIILLYFGMAYQISWNEEEICQEASGGRICIKFSDITNIEAEISKPLEFISASRPFRRISIYAENSESHLKYIDVSLKHFLTADIRQLMQVIHSRRPDLIIPM